MGWQPTAFPDTSQDVIHRTKPTSLDQEQDQEQPIPHSQGCSSPTPISGLLQTPSPPEKENGGSPCFAFHIQATAIRTRLTMKPLSFLGPAGPD